MARSQLQLVADWEREKEDKLANDLSRSRQELLLHQQKLQGLEQYKREYLEQLKAKGADGLGSLSFGQHQSFIEKLDKACEQQRYAIHQAQRVVEHKMSLWLTQQSKRKAVESLLEKKRQEQKLKQDKAEQQLLDEISIQRFFRAKKTA
ncbi:flagellar export protein FliJ [Alteromonadaceae bacterium M269]|nr:flagellar export protein FliJ [Alteromonadaceae bacterium M269]